MTHHSCFLASSHVVLAQWEWWTGFPQFAKVFFHENLFSSNSRKCFPRKSIFKQFVKVSSRERNPLYGILHMVMLQYSQKRTLITSDCLDVTFHNKLWLQSLPPQITHWDLTSNKCLRFIDNAHPPGFGVLSVKVCGGFVSHCIDCTECKCMRVVLYKCYQCACPSVAHAKLCSHPTLLTYTHSFVNYA